MMHELVTRGGTIVDFEALPIIPPSVTWEGGALPGALARGPQPARNR
jgi:hypothetical protein